MITPVKTIQRTNQSSNQCHVAGRTAKRRMRVRLAWCSNVKQSKCELLPTFKWKPLVDHCLILISLTSCREKMGELVRRGPQVFRGPRWVCPKSKKKKWTDWTDVQNSLPITQPRKEIGICPSHSFTVKSIGRETFVLVTHFYVYLLRTCNYKNGYLNKLG